jgi:hypothetical protein
MPLILSALLICASGFAKQNEARVTFSYPAARAKVLFPQLSKAIGLNLETSPQTEGDVFLIRVKNVTGKELMRRIAITANAEWRPEGDSFRLVKTTNLTRTAEAHELEDRKSELKSEIDAAIGKVEGAPAWSASEAERAAKDSQGGLQAVKIGSGGVVSFDSTSSSSSSVLPAQRAIPALLRDLGPAKLSTIGRGIRTVYATQPTPMQHPLGPGSSRIIREFVDQQRQYIEAYDKAHKPDQDSSNGGTNVIIIGGASPEPAPGNPDLGIGQAVLIVRREGESLDVRLVVADPNGATLASGNFQLQPIAKPAAKLSGKDPIVLSALAQEFAKNMESGEYFPAAQGAVVTVSIASTSDSTIPMMFTMDNNGSLHNPSKISQALRERLLHPETFDPQELVPGEAFTSASETLGLNLVANLPDTSFTNISQRVYHEKVSAEDLVSAVGPEAGLDVSRESGWLTVAAHHQATAASSMVNREALGPMLRALNDHSYLRLDDMAAFTMLQDKPTSGNDIDGIYLQMINPGAASKAQIYLDDPWTLRFYATLTPAERSAAQANRPISLSDLLPEQRDSVSYDVFNSGDGPNVQVDNGNRNRRTSVFIGSGYGGSVQTERTQVLAEGLPRDGQLTFHITNQPAVLGIDSHTGTSSVVTANRLASQLYEAERPEFASFGPAPKYDIYRPANESTYMFQFMLMPQVSFTRSLADAFLDLEKPPVEFQGLPQDFKDQVNKQLTQLRNSIGKINGGDTGTAPPP